MERGERRPKKPDEFSLGLSRLFKCKPRRSKYSLKDTVSVWSNQQMETTK